MSVNKKLPLLHNRGILFYALCVRAIANCSIPIFPNKILACHPHQSYNNRLKIGKGNKISDRVEFDNMDSLFYCPRIITETQIFCYLYYTCQHNFEKKKQYYKNNVINSLPALHVQIQRRQYLIAFSRNIPVLAIFCLKNLQQAKLLVSTTTYIKPYICKYICTYVAMSVLVYIWSDSILYVQQLTFSYICADVFTVLNITTEHYKTSSFFKANQSQSQVQQQQHL